MPANDENTAPQVRLTPKDQTTMKLKKSAPPERELPNGSTPSLQEPPLSGQDSPRETLGNVSPTTERSPLLQPLLDENGGTFLLPGSLAAHESSPEVRGDSNGSPGRSPGFGLNSGYYSEQEIGSQGEPIDFDQVFRDCLATRPSSSERSRLRSPETPTAVRQDQRQLSQQALAEQALAPPMPKSAARHLFNENPPPSSLRGRDSLDFRCNPDLVPSLAHTAPRRTAREGVGPTNPTPLSNSQGSNTTDPHLNPDAPTEPGREAFIKLTLLWPTICRCADQPTKEMLHRSLIGDKKGNRLLRDLRIYHTSLSKRKTLPSDEEILRDELGNIINTVTKIYITHRRQIIWSNIHDRVYRMAQLLSCQPDRRTRKSPSGLAKSGTVNLSVHSEMGAPGDDSLRWDGDEYQSNFNFAQKILRELRELSETRELREHPQHTNAQASGPLSSPDRLTPFKYSHHHQRAAYNTPGGGRVWAL